MRLPLFSTALLLAAIVSAATVSPDGTCGGSNGYTCLGSYFGNCCSKNGWCGQQEAYCGAGCQGPFGNCDGLSNPNQAVSTDGTCGGTNGFTCTGSNFGTCCSQSGWCGGTAAYCGGGCQPGFGACRQSPNPGQVVSPDATCGGDTGYTCGGSIYGDCCSQSGYCGSTDDYCGSGCQNGFGLCTTPATSTTTATAPTGTLPPCNLLTDGEFDDVSPTNTTNIVSGGWTFTGSAEVWNYKDTNGANPFNKWVVFPGTSGTISQDIAGLLVGKPYQLLYQYSVVDAPEGGYGACNLTASIAGTQIDKLVLNTSLAPGAYTYFTPENVAFTATAASGAFVLEFDCSQPLVVWFDEVSVGETGILCD